jgi:hypothetical protein
VIAWLRDLKGICAGLDSADGDGTVDGVPFFCSNSLESVNIDDDEDDGLGGAVFVDRGCPSALFTKVGFAVGAVFPSAGFVTVGFVVGAVFAFGFTADALVDFCFVVIVLLVGWALETNSFLRRPLLFARIKVEDISCFGGQLLYW